MASYTHCKLQYFLWTTFSLCVQGICHYLHLQIASLKVKGNQANLKMNTVNYNIVMPKFTCSI